MGPSKLTVGICAVITETQAERLAAADRRLDVRWEADLYAPQRFEGDYQGDLHWCRTPEQQARYDAICNSADALLGIPDPADTSSLRRCVETNPNLVWLHTMAAGGGGQVRMAKLSAPDLERLTITTSAGVHAVPLSEFAIYGVLAGAKALPVMLERQRQHLWGERFMLREIADMNIVVIGMGGIGRLVTQRFTYLGAHVIGVNRTMRDVPGVEMHTTADVVEVVKRADAIINCLPAALGTQQLISAEVLAAAKPGVIFVSLGRGSCVDEAALIDNLRSGHISFAALDVFEHEPLPTDSPLWDLPNVLISSHMIALSIHETDRIIDLFVANAKALMDGTPMQNLLNKELFY